LLVIWSKVRTHVSGYWFTSSLFDIEPDEQDASNPQRDGRQLALWLRSRLEQRGYVIEKVVAEDWGWCVICQSKPFLLWVGCGTMDDAGDEPEAPRSQTESPVWHCFPAAERPWLARLFCRGDAAPDVRRLDADLREILSSAHDVSLLP
jgi:hypothetical protein